MAFIIDQVGCVICGQSRNPQATSSIFVLCSLFSLQGRQRHTLVKTIQKAVVRIGCGAGSTPTCCRTKTAGVCAKYWNGAELNTMTALYASGCVHSNGISQLW
jgi:hypothetical protein